MNFQVSEDRVIREHYPFYDRIAAELPERNLSQLHDRAKALGLAGHDNEWTAAELKRFKELYPVVPLDELKAAFPNRSLRSMQTIASRRGLHRPPQPLHSTGNLLIDAIRRRAQQEGIRLSDLDAMIGFCNYFGARKMRSNKKSSPRCFKWVSINAIAKAVEMLGGELTITWPDE